MPATSSRSSSGTENGSVGGGVPRAGGEAGGGSGAKKSTAGTAGKTKGKMQQQGGSKEGGAGGKKASSQSRYAPGRSKQWLLAALAKLARDVPPNAVITLECLLDEWVHLDPPQLEAKLKSFIAQAKRTGEVHKYEIDPANFETDMGKDGAGGWIDGIKEHVKDAPTAEEKPAEPTRHKHVDQTPELPYSVFQAILALLKHKPGARADIRSPALGPNVLRLLVVCLKDELHKGMKLSIGTCVTEKDKYGAQYEGVVRLVEEEWGLKGALRLYYVTQLEGFASPHRKPIIIVFEDGTMIAVSTSANLTDRGTAAGVPFAETVPESRKTSKSYETLDATFYDLRHPDGEGFKRLQQLHTVNKVIRAERSFVWNTQGLRDSFARERIVVKRDDPSEVEHLVKAKYREEIRAQRDAPAYTDLDVDTSTKQTAIIAATASSGGVKLAKDPTIAKSQPFLPLYTKEQRAEIEHEISLAFSLMPRPKRAVKKTGMRSLKKRWRKEVEEEEGVTEEDPARMTKKRKPLSSGTGPGVSTTPRPKLIRAVAAATAQKDEQRRLAMIEEEEGVCFGEAGDAHANAVTEEHEPRSPEDEKDDNLMVVDEEDDDGMIVEDIDGWGLQAHTYAAGEPDDRMLVDGDEGTVETGAVADARPAVAEGVGALAEDEQARGEEVGEGGKAQRGTHDASAPSATIAARTAAAVADAMSAADTAAPSTGSSTQPHGQTAGAMGGQLATFDGKGEARGKGSTPPSPASTGRAKSHEAQRPSSSAKTASARSPASGKAPASKPSRSKKVAKSALDELISQMFGRRNASTAATAKKTATPSPAKSGKPSALAKSDKPGTPAAPKLPAASPSARTASQADTPGRASTSTMSGSATASKATASSGVAGSISAAPARGTASPAQSPTSSGAAASTSSPSPLAPAASTSMQRKSAAPSVKSQKKKQKQKRILQPIPWTDAQRKILVDGRKSKPPMPYKKIAERVGHTSGACEVEHARIAGKDKRPIKRFTNALDEVLIRERQAGRLFNEIDTIIGFRRGSSWQRYKMLEKRGVVRADTDEVAQARAQAARSAGRTRQARAKREARQKGVEEKREEEDERADEPADERADGSEGEDERAKEDEREEEDELDEDGELEESETDGEESETDEEESETDEEELDEFEEEFEADATEAKSAATMEPVKTRSGRVSKKPARC
ncbi:hypothetical protein JCM10450v2_000210 [Rhodotorula kratochvilovae]